MPDEKFKRVQEQFCILCEYITEFPESLRFRDQVKIAYFRKVVTELSPFLLKEEISVAEEESLFRGLAEYLEKNWRLIQGTCLSYTALPEAPVTLLVCEIAEWLAEKAKSARPAEEGRYAGGGAAGADGSVELAGGHTAFEFLMPGMPLLHDYILFEAVDVTDVRYLIRTHIEAEDGKTLIPLSALATTEEAASLRNPYDEDCRSLSEKERQQLFDHSPAARELIAAKAALHAMTHDEAHLLGQLNQLLHFLGVNQAGGLGDENNAGIGAYRAISNFNQYYQHLSESAKTAIPGAIQSVLDDFLRVGSEREYRVLGEISPDELNEIQSIPQSEWEAQEHYTEALFDKMRRLNRETYIGASFKGKEIAFLIKLLKDNGKEAISQKIKKYQTGELPIESCIAILKRRLREEMLGEESTLAGISLTRAETDSEVRELTTTLEALCKTLNDAITNKTYSGCDPLGLSNRVLIALDLPFKVNSFSDVDELMGFSAEEIQALVSADSELKSTICHHIESIENLLLLCLEFSNEKVGAFFKVMKNEIFSRLISNAQDYQSLLIALPSEKFSAVFDVIADVFFEKTLAEGRFDSPWRELFVNYYRMFDESQQRIINQALVRRFQAISRLDHLKIFLIDVLPSIALNTLINQVIANIDTMPRLIEAINIFLGEKCSSSVQNIFKTVAEKLIDTLPKLMELMSALNEEQREALYFLKFPRLFPELRAFISFLNSISREDYVLLRPIIVNQLREYISSPDALDQFSSLNEAVWELIAPDIIPLIRNIDRFITFLNLLPRGLMERPEIFPLICAQCKTVISTSNDNLVSLVQGLSLDKYSLLKELVQERLNERLNSLEQMVKFLNALPDEKYALIAEFFEQKFNELVRTVGLSLLTLEGKFYRQIEAFILILEPSKVALIQPMIDSMPFEWIENKDALQTFLRYLGDEKFDSSLEGIARKVQSPLPSDYNFFKLSTLFSFLLPLGSSNKKAEKLLLHLAPKIPLRDATDLANFINTLTSESFSLASTIIQPMLRSALISKPESLRQFFNRIEPGGYLLVASIIEGDVFLLASDIREAKHLLEAVCEYRKDKEIEPLRPVDDKVIEAWAKLVKNFNDFSDFSPRIDDGLDLTVYQLKILKYLSEKDRLPPLKTMYDLSVMARMTSDADNFPLFEKFVRKNKQKIKNCLEAMTAQDIVKGLGAFNYPQFQCLFEMQEVTDTLFAKITTPDVSWECCKTLGDVTLEKEEHQKYLVKFISSLHDYSPRRFRDLLSQDTPDASRFVRGFSFFFSTMSSIELLESPKLSFYILARQYGVPVETLTKGVLAIKDDESQLLILELEDYIRYREAEPPYLGMARFFSWLDNRENKILAARHLCHALKEKNATVLTAQDLARFGNGRLYEIAQSFLTMIKHPGSLSDYVNRYCGVRRPGAGHH